MLRDSEEDRHVPRPQHKPSRRGHQREDIQPAQGREGRHTQPPRRPSGEAAGRGGAGQEGHHRQAPHDNGAVQMRQVRHGDVGPSARDAPEGAHDVLQPGGELQQAGHPLHPGRQGVRFHRHTEDRDPGEPRGPQGRRSAREDHWVRRGRHSRRGHSRKQDHAQRRPQVRGEVGQGQVHGVRDLSRRGLGGVRAARVRRDPDHRRGREGDPPHVQGPRPLRQHSQVHIPLHLRSGLRQEGHRPPALRRLPQGDGRRHRDEG